MRGKAYLPSNRRRQAEQDPRRERDSPLLGGVPAGRGGYGARDQAGRSDNNASRACRFEVSPEQSAKDGLFLTEILNQLSFNRFYPFSRNR